VLLIAKEKIKGENKSSRDADISLIYLDDIPMEASKENFHLSKKKMSEISSQIRSMATTIAV